MEHVADKNEPVVEAFSFRRSQTRAYLNILARKYGQGVTYFSVIWWLNYHPGDKVVRAALRSSIGCGRYRISTPVQGQIRLFHSTLQIPDFSTAECGVAAAKQQLLEYLVEHYDFSKTFGLYHRLVQPADMPVEFDGQSPLSKFCDAMTSLVDADFDAHLRIWYLDVDLDQEVLLIKERTVFVDTQLHVESWIRASLRHEFYPSFSTVRGGMTAIVGAVRYLRGKYTVNYRSKPYIRRGTPDGPAGPFGLRDPVNDSTVGRLSRRDLGALMTSLRLPPPSYSVELLQDHCAVARMELPLSQKKGDALVSLGMGNDVQAAIERCATQAYYFLMLDDYGLIDDELPAGFMLACADLSYMLVVVTVEGDQPNSALFLGAGHVCSGGGSRVDTRFVIDRVVECCLRDIVNLPELEADDGAIGSAGDPIALD